MGARGYPPKPTALKILEGNPGRRPLPVDEPQPKVGAPKCPAWLSLEAKREWRRIAPQLERLGVLTEIDGTALAAYCQTYARWKAAELVIEQDGMTFTMEETGRVMARPEVLIARQCLQLIKSFGAEFGLTPSSRTRVKATKVAEEDPFEDYLSGRAN